MSSQYACSSKDGWLAPKRRKKKAGVNGSPAGIHQTGSPSETVVSQLEASLLDLSISYDAYSLKSVQKWMDTLRKSSFWRDLTRLESLSTLLPSQAPSTDSSRIVPLRIDRIVCLGLGSMDTTAIGSNRARAQFAFLLLLREFLNGAKTSVDSCNSPISTYICDPTFSALDVALLRHFQVEILKNVCGRYSASEALPIITNTLENGNHTGISSGTLFWMPHCPKELYASVLSSNWNRTDISKIVIIGNSFANIVESLCPEEEKIRLGRIFKAFSLLHHSIATLQIPEYVEDPYIFSGTSIHRFDLSSELLAPEGDDFWKIPENESEALGRCLKECDPTISENRTPLR